MKLKRKISSISGIKDTFRTMYNHHHHHHAHAAYHPHMVAPHPHLPYSSAGSSPSTVAAISSPTLLGTTVPGGYLTSPTDSSIQLMSSPPHNGAHPLIGLQGGGGEASPAHSHLQGGLQDPQSVAMQMAGGSGSGLMGAPSYDGGELTELKKRR